MKFTLLIPFILITFSLSAQKSGFTKLKQEKYTEAKEIFKFILEEKTNNAASYFGLSLLYAEEKFKEFNIQKAFAYADSSVNFHNLLSAEEKKNFLSIFNNDSLKNNFKNLEEI